jgi:hypothetical protein
LLWGLLPASSMAESSHCFRNCIRNSVCRMVLVTSLHPLKGADEVSGEVVIVKSQSYILLLMVLEQMWDWHFCSHRCVCFSFFVCFLSPIVWYFFRLPEEVLTLLFLLHHENEFLYSYERYFFSFLLHYFGQEQIFFQSNIFVMKRVGNCKLLHVCSFPSSVLFFQCCTQV